MNTIFSSIPVPSPSAPVVQQGRNWHRTALLDKEPGCRGFKGPSPSTTLDKDVDLNLLHVDSDECKIDFSLPASALSIPTSALCGSLFDRKNQRNFFSAVCRQVGGVSTVAIWSGEKSCEGRFPVVWVQIFRFIRQEISEMSVLNKNNGVSI